MGKEMNLTAAEEKQIKIEKMRRIRDIREQEIDDYNKGKNDDDRLDIDVKDINVMYSYNQDAWLDIDEQWSIEALSNIVKNCIEHLHIGGQLSIIFTHNPIYDEIIISDNGKGIDNDDLPHLFERFYKGKASNSNSVGIGLALTKKIIDCQDGTITVENTYPGAKFTIHFYKEVV
jgi:signal transduction histidine kinase